MEKKFAKDYDGRIFYKISKSTPKITSKCLERHYIEYPENSLVRDTGEHRLCFVPENTVIYCIPYGDQLTEIIYNSQDSRFCEIADEEVYSGPCFGELNSRAVLTGHNYSLSNPSVLQKIFSMTSQDTIQWFANHGQSVRPVSVENHLRNLGFFDSLIYWQKYMNSRKTWKSMY